MYYLNDVVPKILFVISKQDENIRAKHTAREIAACDTNHSLYLLTSANSRVEAQLTALGAPMLYAMMSPRV